MLANAYRILVWNTPPNVSARDGDGTGLMGSVTVVVLQIYWHSVIVQTLWYRAGGPNALRFIIKTRSNIFKMLVISVSGGWAVSACSQPWTSNLFLALRLDNLLRDSPSVSGRKVCRSGSAVTEMAEHTPDQRERGRMTLPQLCLQMDSALNLIISLVLFWMEHQEQNPEQDVSSPWPFPKK